MGLRIIRRPRARRDIIEAARYIAYDSPQAALRFAGSVRDTEALLAESPNIGAIREFARPELSRMRMHSVQGFRKYPIFYIPHPDRIEIVRVLHGAREIAALFEEK
jgi:toxin ParE1/3/4